MRVDGDMTDDADSFSLLLGTDVPTRDYKAGDTIFREGDPGTEFYVVQRGRVRILSGNRLLETLGENEIFGEMALIELLAEKRDRCGGHGRHRRPDNGKAVSFSGPSYALLRAQGDAGSGEPAQAPE